MLRHLFSASTPLTGRGDTVPVARRLAETIAWCAQQPALRSERLRPRLLEPDRATTVRTVAHLRAAFVSSDALSQAVAADTARGAAGRLLAYFPDADLADGAAEVESGGFFDANNLPPWDTWVALLAHPRAVGDSSYGEFVLCWVPEPHLGAAARGIEVNPEECICWFDAHGFGLPPIHAAV